MARILGLAGLVAVLAAAGCADTRSPPIEPPAGKPRLERAGIRDCPNENAPCTIDVSVFCTIDPSDHCVIVVVEPVITMSVTNNARKFKLKLTDANFRFPSSGAITFPNSKAPFDCSQNNDPVLRQCEYTSTTATAGQYKFNIKVESRNGSRTVDPLDPWVVTN